MSALICGSIAFDTIMTFDGCFREQILPEQLHILNVCFTVPGLRQEFGGCAGNIAYSFRLLGETPLIMGTVGHDSQSYLTRFATLGIDYQHVRTIPDLYTAQAIITTDKENNQITSFHPGALAHAHLNKITDTQNVELCILGPDQKQATLEHANECAMLGIPFIFDPGQMLPTFSANELVELLGLSSYLTLNDYEAQLFTNTTKLSVEQIAQHVKALIITHAERGATIIENGNTHHIPAIKPTRALDPTGCGDAFRAGLLYGITYKLDWLTTGRLANLLGSIKVEYLGPQNHQFTLEEISERFKQTFGYQF